MPGFNGTGPLGLGPMTGRGMGYCAMPLSGMMPYGYAGYPRTPMSGGYPYVPPSSFSAIPYAPFIGWPRFGMRFGRGFGRGFWGWGRGRGRGRGRGWGW